MQVSVTYLVTRTHKTYGL